MLIAFVERRWRRLVSRFCAPEPKQTRANIGESSELICLDPLELFRCHNDGALVGAIISARAGTPCLPIGFSRVSPASS